MSLTESSVMETERVHLQDLIALPEEKHESSDADEALEEQQSDIRQSRNMCGEQLGVFFLFLKSHRRRTWWNTRLLFKCVISGLIFDLYISSISCLEKEYLYRCKGLVRPQQLIKLN